MRFTTVHACCCVWLIAACRQPGPDASAKNAAVSADDAAPAPSSIDAGTVADAGMDASDAEAVDAARSDAELTLAVAGVYCTDSMKSSPACRSYTYSVRTDGKFRGSARTSPVPPAEVDALFDLATTAFADKYRCIPFPPDRGDRTITLRIDGKSRVAHGGACGPRFDELEARMKKLAASK